MPWIDSRQFTAAKIYSKSKNSLSQRNACFGKPVEDQTTKPSSSLMVWSIRPNSWDRPGAKQTLRGDRIGADRTGRKIRKSQRVSDWAKGAIIPTLMATLPHIIEYFFTHPFVVFLASVGAGSVFASRWCGGLHPRSMTEVFHSRPFSRRGRGDDRG